MEQLSGLDASFLYMESPRSPMHIGGLYFCEPSQGGKGPDFARFRKHIASRLHVSRTFRQKLVPVPYNLGHPYWIDDADFDLDLHLPRIKLPNPGGLDAVLNLAQTLFGTPLDRGRPLWEIAFVEGLGEIEELPQGGFAIITRVHHAAIDGGSGAEILGALFDLTPRPGTLLKPKPWKGEPVPTTAELLARTYGKAVGKTLSLYKFLGRTVADTAKAVAYGRAHQLQPPPFPMTAPRSRLNVPVSPARSFGFKIWSLDRIKAIKNRLSGATVNDVVLAVCAGALRSYLLEKDALPEKPLVAMAPVSVRSEEQRGQMGNQVSAMLVNLATHEPDPLQRLVLIHQSARGSKVYSKALSGHKLLDFIPSETAALAARLYTRMRVAEKHRPFFNLVITNVPGPQVPLYLGGARLCLSTGTAPVFDGMGLILVVTSYAGSIAISATACREILPDMGFFTECLDRALVELEQALARGELPVLSSKKAGAREDPTSKDKRGKRTWQDRVSYLDETLNKLERLARQETADTADAEGSAAPVTATSKK